MSTAVLCLASVGCGSSGSSSNDSGSGTPCDFAAADMIFANKGCAANGCHDGTATESANFDMATAGWQDHLLGVNPRGGGTLSACVASDGPYLTAGSNPATGLFIRKISGTGNLCTGGVRMPFGMPSAYLTAAQITCVTQWATTLTHP